MRDTFLHVQIMKGNHAMHNCCIHDHDANSVRTKAYATGSSCIRYRLGTLLENPAENN